MRQMALATILATIAAPANADRVSLLLGTAHFDGGNYEEVNPGIFYTFEREPLDVTAGVYRNSYGNTSVSLTVGLPLATWEQGELSIFAGAAHYPTRSKPVRPIGGLQIRHGHVFGQYIPAEDGIVTFGLTFDLGE